MQRVIIEKYDTCSWDVVYQNSLKKQSTCTASLFDMYVSSLIILKIIVLYHLDLYVIKRYELNQRYCEYGRHWMTTILCNSAMGLLETDLEINPKNIFVFCLLNSWTKGYLYLQQKSFYLHFKFRICGQVLIIVFIKYTIFLTMLCLQLSRSKYMIDQIKVETYQNIQCLIWSS